MQSKTKVLVAVVAVMMIVVLYVGISSMQPIQRPGVKEIDLNIQNRKLNLPIINVVQGDNITLRITSDEKAEFHIHGYDLLVELEPGKTSTLGFTADKAGTFEIELHLDKNPQGGQEEEVSLGSLQVTPPS